MVVELTDGFEVVGEAESGAQAVDKYRQLKPDLVTMDIVMPDMGGIEAVREICKTDPDAKLFRKGKAQPAKLYFMGHALIENRHGLVVQADATAATGKAERQAALAMIDRHDPGSERRLTLAADKGYDTSDFVGDRRPRTHVA